MGVPLAQFDKTTGRQYIIAEDEFEWDAAKAESNVEKHGVSYPHPTSSIPVIRRDKPPDGIEVFRSLRLKTPFTASS
ncbi:MAG: hypothetical protein ABSH45_16570 [Bryobacteraceae bacterium]|jgi:hypothetical protein